MDLYTPNIRQQYIQKSNIPSRNNLMETLMFKKVQTHQCVAFATSIAGHRHGYRAGEVFSWRCTAGSAAHWKLWSAQAQIQSITGHSRLDGSGTASSVHPLKAWDQWKNRSVVLDLGADIIIMIINNKIRNPVVFIWNGKGFNCDAFKEIWGGFVIQSKRI